MALPALAELADGAVIASGATILEAIESAFGSDPAMPTTIFILEHVTLGERVLVRFRAEVDASVLHHHSSHGNMIDTHEGVARLLQAPGGRFTVVAIAHEFVS